MLSRRKNIYQGKKFECSLDNVFFVELMYKIIKLHKTHCKLEVTKIDYENILNESYSHGLIMINTKNQLLIDIEETQNIIKAIEDTG
ncbi:MAG: hypothetical protein IH840_17135 [Candidatus Heimdallarchaeota archaeon]|nr:hypothetical protein [Candidatus Heimdallarchaeota archaeon]